MFAHVYDCKLSVEYIKNRDAQQLVPQPRSQSSLAGNQMWRHLSNSTGRFARAIVSDPKPDKRVKAWDEAAHQTLK